TPLRLVFVLLVLRSGIHALTTSPPASELPFSSLRKLCCEAELAVTTTSVLAAISQEPWSISLTKLRTWSLGPSRSTLPTPHFRPRHLPLYPVAAPHTSVRSIPT